jgi:predicted nucleic acid-binding protein
MTDREEAIVKRRMTGKDFFDTNVLVYAIMENDSRKVRARELLASGGVISAQVLNEFVSVVRRKVQMSWKDVREALQWIRILCPDPVPLTIDIQESALTIAEVYGYGIHDALIAAAAIEAGCGILYSEDFQDGQVIEHTLTVRNPFQ